MKSKKLQKNRGMTYVELIVVLGIFGLMSSVILFNYGKFQEKVDISNLANDIALKITEAQKSAMSGKLNTLVADPDWKPSYGLYFNITQNPKKFIYFADFDNSNSCENFSGSTCAVSDNVGGEILEVIDITKGNYVEKIGLVNQQGVGLPSIPEIGLRFTRPNSGAYFIFPTQPAPLVEHIKIMIASPKGLTSEVRVYPSGRIQIN